MYTEDDQITIQIWIENTDLNEDDAPDVWVSQDNHEMVSYAFNSSVVNVPAMRKAEAHAQLKNYTYHEIKLPLE